VCVCVCVRVRACVRACARARVRARESRFVDEDGQAHVVMKKGAAEAHKGERILRRTNPQLI
jgi:hypothetical protein